MSLVIKEYLGNNCIKTEEFKTKNQFKKNNNITESFSKRKDNISNDSLMQLIEGIHVGPTRNYTWYTEEALKGSISSWTQPYEAPLIMHHNETDGKIIGRIKSVNYKEKNTRSGTGALIFTCNVPDKEGKEQILDGRLKTVSIGVLAHDVRCSICNKPIEIDSEGNSCCGHERGESYDDEICYWKIFSMEAKELSYVIVPSDIYAHNLETYKANEFKESFSAKSNLQENLNINGGNAMNKNGNNKNGNNKKQSVQTNSIEENGEKSTKIIEENGTENTENFAQENKELKVKNEELKNEVTSLKDEITTLKDDKEKAATELKNLKVEIEKIQIELSQERQLKENIEADLIKKDKEIRKNIEENLNNLRVSLGKPLIAKESLEKRSLESIKDSIADLKNEEKSLKEGLSNITSIEDPTLKTEKIDKKNTTSVKEEKTASNINLEEGLQDLLKSFF